MKIQKKDILPYSTLILILIVNPSKNFALNFPLSNYPMAKKLTA
jgi:hypothetical protein